MSYNDKPVKDYVCGMVKLKSQMVAKSVFNGETYYFCTKDDKDMFDSHPEAWIPRDE